MQEKFSVKLTARLSGEIDKNVTQNTKNIP